MKKLIVILVMLAAVSASGQWVQVQNPNNAVSKVLNYNGDILIGCYTPHVFKSTNLGQTWTIFYGGVYMTINALSNVDGNVWVSNYYTNAYTTNNGLNWTTTNLSKYVYDFASNNGRIFAGTESWRCYYTDNGGMNWALCQDIWEDVNCFFKTGVNFLAGTSQGLFYTTNNGTNWNQAQLGGIGINDIVSNSSKLFAGSIWGVWTSTNNGYNWIQTSLNNANVIAMDTYSNNDIIAGTEGSGVYVSTNNGLNWIQRNEGLTNINIVSLAIVGNTIFAVAGNQTLWKRQLSEIVNIHNISTEVPMQFKLYQNYPNPFNPTTKIRFSIVSSPHVLGGDLVQLKIYDIMGREIQTLVNERLQPGTYEVTFNIESATEHRHTFGTGVYFYKLKTDGFSETKRMILTK